jgi:hypothetical protein
MLGNTWVAERLAASQEGLSSMQLLSYSVSQYVSEYMSHLIKKSLEIFGYCRDQLF